MRKHKRCLGLISAIAMVFSLITIPASAGEVVLVDDGTRLPTPRASQVVVEASISSLGASWVQPFGNNSYKIWVDNTTDQVMTVTHVSGLRNDTYEVEPNSKRVVAVVNNAIPFAEHRLDFSTPNGVLSGRVTVRVSDVDQSY